MQDYVGERRIEADPVRAWDYLSDVDHLPEYFSRMTSVQKTGPEEVHTRAELELPDGTQEVEAEAWFRRDEQAHQIEWGSEGDNDYHGRLVVDGDGDTSTVRVEIHTESGHEGIEHGIEETLDAIESALSGKPR